MASEKQLPKLELNLGLSVAGSNRRMPPPSDGDTGGLPSFNFEVEDGKAGRVDLERGAGIGASPEVACSAEVLEAHRWSFGSILGGTGNPLGVPVQYPSHSQVMNVPTVDGFGVPSMIPYWAPEVLPPDEGLDQPVACWWSGTAGKGVRLMPLRADSTAGISMRGSGPMQARNMSMIWSSSSNDERGKSLHISENPQSQKVVSVPIQVSYEKLASRIPTSDITSTSAIPMLKRSNYVNKHIVAAKEPEQSPLPWMPYVVARGDGPNGKRITGVLYKYNQYEKVSIFCVCHGISFSPAEFVRHAGGTETAHLLRQIIVVPSLP